MPEIKDVSLTEETLREIRSVDMSAYGYARDLGWYLERYHPWHSAFAAVDGGRIVGYLAAFPIQKALYDALVSGVLVDDAGISPNMFLKDSEYIYVCSIAIEPAYRDHTISRRMVEMLLEKYRGKKLCLITVTGKGRRLAACYFEHRLRVTESVDVFVGHRSGEWTKNISE